MEVDGSISFPPSMDPTKLEVLNGQYAVSLSEIYYWKNCPEQALKAVFEETGIMEAASPRAVEVEFDFPRYASPFGDPDYTKRFVKPGNGLSQPQPNLK